MAAGTLVWWAIIVFLGWLAVPAAVALCPRFPDRGFALGKPLALIAFAYVSWLLRDVGLARLPALTVAIVVLAGSTIVYRRQVATLRLHEVVLQEGLFTLAFAFFGGIRALHPDIFGGEKFMDFALLNTLVRTDVFPPEDPWLAGFPLNYYYFGHLLVANVASISGVSLAVAYNLALATVGAVVFTLATTVSRALTGRLGLGLLGGAAAVVLGNLDAAKQLLGEHSGLAGFDYYRSSRVVPYAITEFPFFSVFHGDLHAHVLALIPTALLVALGVGGWQETRRRALRVTTLTLALVTLLLANPWNVPLCLVFLALLQLGAMPAGPFTPNRVWLAVLMIAAPAVCAVLLALPFTLHFAPPFQGFGRAHDATPVASLLVMFGFLLLPALVFTLRQVTTRRCWTGHRAALTIAGGGLLVLGGCLQGASFFLSCTIACTALAMLAGPWRGDERAIPLVLLATAAIAIALGELVFVREPTSPEFYRRNTVFKLWVQAWLLLAIGLPAFVRHRRAHPGAIPTLGAPLLALGLAASVCYPVAAIASRISSTGFHPDLDGTRYLEREHPDDAAAIAWLAEEVRGRPVVLEATGEPYTYFARVSSATGFPTVLGWSNHERVWRSDQTVFTERASDIGKIYGSDDLAAVTSLLRRYRVRYVFVGELERRGVPPARLAKFTEHPELFTPVFTSGSTTVFRIGTGNGAG